MLKPGLSVIVRPNLSRVVVWMGGRTVADTRRALTLRIGEGPAINYVPFEDVQIPLLERRPIDASLTGVESKVYFDILLGSNRVEFAAWAFDKPLGDIAAVSRHVAFDARKVDAIEQQPRHGMMQPW